MSSQIIRKIEKLPPRIVSDDISYFYRISRDPATKYYNLSYIDYIAENTLISIEHKSFQALVDETIHSLKELKFLK